MYQYTACGLDHIWLKNGYEISETESGKGLSIHDMDGLYMAIAKGIAAKNGAITGKEFRFLRVELDLSQKAIGTLMGKKDQTIATWEKGTQDIPPLADKGIRDLYMESIGESPIAGILKTLSELDRNLHELELKLEETSSGWETEKAA